MKTDVKNVLDFWFGSLDEISDRLNERSKFWYVRNPETDLSINGISTNPEKEYLSQPGAGF